jgi:sugar phosphate isomerase/epimerase
VENCFEPSTTAQEAMNLVKHFDSPCIGLCLDCGHANLMEPMEGRDVTKMVSYIRKAWQKTGSPLFTPQIAEFMSPEIVTVHVHDNDGLNDKHAVPDEHGTIDWKRLNRILHNSPRLLSLQSEAGDSAENPLEKIEHISRTLRTLWQ